MANRYYSTKYNGNKVITWKNFTDTSTPLSAANLQKSHQAIQEIDTGVNSAFEAVDNTKLDKTSANNMVDGIEYTPGTGVFVFHFYGGTTLTIDTNLEKVAVNFTYNPETQKLEILQADGTTVEVDLSAFVANPDLINSDTIAWTVHSDGSLEANVRNGSITDEMIEAHYLASIMSIAGQVENDKETADYYSRLAKSYANGTSNLPDRPTESVDNASYYMTQSQGYSVISGSYMNIAGTHASNAEAYAIGKRNGQPVYPPDPTYQNSSKYWAENSALFAMKAEDYAGISGSYMNISGSYMNIAKTYRDEAEHSSIISGSYMNMAQQYSERAGSYMNISASIMNVTGAYADDALDSARKSQSYARGDAVNDQGQPYRPGQETDNAKHYKELAEAAAQQVGALDFMGATETTDGAHGLVPAPQAGDEDKVLSGDGTWGHKLQIDIVERNGVYGYIDSGGNFVDFKSQADIDAAVAAARVGTATAADVKAGVTFTNSTASGLKGTFAAQTKSATPSLSEQTITPDSGKYLSSVSISAISPDRTTDSMIVPQWGSDSTAYVPATRIATLNPRVDFRKGDTYGSAEMIEITMPEGYYIWAFGKSSCCIPTETKEVNAGTSAITVKPTAYNAGGNYVKYLKSVTVNPTPSQSKTITASRDNQTVSPDSGKLLSSVTVNKYPDASGTYTPAANSSASDMGATNNYRYVDTRTVYNLGSSAGLASGYTTVVQIPGSSAGSGAYNYSVSNGHYYILFAYNTKGFTIKSGATLIKTGGPFNTYLYIQIVKATSTTMKLTPNGSVNPSSGTNSMVARLY